MAEEKKKISGGVIAAICAVVIAAIVAVVAVVIINNNKGGLAGKYTLSSIVDASGNEVDPAAAGGMVEYTLELKEDKTGTLVMKMDASQYSELVDDPSTLKSETTVNVTYDDSKMKMDNNGVTSESNYEYKDGMLTLELNGSKMKFKKA